MEWKTAKEMALELGVTQSAVYEGIKRGGKVGGETLEKGGPGGRHYRIKSAKSRIPKPPLTIKEVPADLDGDVWARFQGLEEQITKLREEAVNAQKDHKIDAHCLAERIEQLSGRLELWTSKLEDVDRSVTEYVDRALARRFDVDSTESASHISKRLEHHIENDHQEVKDRVAKIQDRLAKLVFEDLFNLESRSAELLKELNIGSEFRDAVNSSLNQVNERLDLQHKIQSQLLSSMREMRGYEQDSVERIVVLEKGEAYFKEKITGILNDAGAAFLRIDEIEATLKSFNWDGFDGRPKRGEVIGLIRGGVQEELKRVNKSEDRQTKAILNDIGRLFKRIVDLESTRTLDEEFKRDTNRTIEALIKNVMRLQGLSVDKSPSAADIMKRTVKAASAFADAMKGDL